MNTAAVHFQPESSAKAEVPDHKAGIQEIFSSIQGEGPYVGYRQIFVRFNACHLKCTYCDTPPHPAAQSCKIETISGTGQTTELTNPISTDETLYWIQYLHQRYCHHSISLTGGEPLLYTDFLEILLPTVSSWLPVYLETSGTQPDKLMHILPWVDIIAMDVKLPSATGEPMQLENHQRFYHACQDKNLFIKLIFSNATTPQELRILPDIVTNQNTPIILQPITDPSTGQNTVFAPKIFELASSLGKHYADVRVIPQTHKMLTLL